MRKYFLITEKGCRYLLYRVNGLTRAHIKEWFGKTPEKEKEFAQENRATDKLGDITKTKAETIIPVKNLYVAKLEEDRKKNEELTEKLIQEREEDMNEVQLLDQREVLGKQFKIYGTVDEPLFLAKDVAEWIEYNISNVSKLVNSVDEDEKMTRTIYTSDGNATTAWLLTEEGLYEVLMQSRKPIAKEFKKQVKIILKDIRKHGMYATDELLDNPDLLIQVATKLKEEKEKNILLLSKTEQQEKRIVHLEPHADFSKDFLKSEGTIQIGSLAKHLYSLGMAVGRNRLFNYLKENGYVCYEGEYNVPTQKSMNLGIMKIEYLNFSFFES